MHRAESDQLLYEGATILAIDDRHDLLLSLDTLLTAYRFKVITCQNGHLACDLLATTPVDLVILDLRMPGMSGFEFMTHLQAHYSDIPFLVVSGETSFSAVSRVLKAGAFDFIRKPYAAEQLISSIRHALHQHALAEQNRIMHEQLKASEALHRFMINHSPDIIYMLDEAGRFQYINDSVTTLLNYHPDELIGQPYDILLPRAEREHHLYSLNERRAGKRKTHNKEIQLKRRAREDDPACPGAATLCFEICAMGVYETLDDQRAVFKGSYGIARDITARKQAESVIHFQAYHDLLTGLPNRSLLRDRLQNSLSQARRDDEHVVVMFLDLDRFKIVNDTLGHCIGDQLLQAVSRRLQSCLREGDTLARFGGDEFALLLPRTRQKEDADIIARKILHVLETPFMIDNHQLYLSTSIGIALFPEAGEDMDTLIRHADIAMYHVKHHGKNSYQYYSEEIGQAYHLRLMLERD